MIDEPTPSMKHTRSIQVLCAVFVTSVEGWYQAAPSELTGQEFELLSGARHFGRTVAWGLVEDPDPCGQVWPPTELRPIAAGFQAIYVGEA